MYLIKLPVILLFLVSYSSLAKYDYLDEVEKNKLVKMSNFEGVPLYISKSKKKFAINDYSLKNYFNDFQKDGLLNIYIGFGKDAYDKDSSKELLTYLAELNKGEALGWTNIILNKTKNTISFEAGALDIEVQIGSIRSEYISSFSKYDVIMYHGHSRLGRGPAFEHYTNYFRMGTQFTTVEVDALLPAFLNEEIKMLQDYLELESLRFDNAFSYNITIDDNLNTNLSSINN